MYIVKVKDTNETVAICSRKVDAESYIRSQLDNIQYVIEKE